MNEIIKSKAIIQEDLIIGNNSDDNDLPLREDYLDSDEEELSYKEDFDVSVEEEEGENKGVNFWFFISCYKFVF